MQANDKWYMIIFDVLITLTGEVFIALSWHGLWTISDALQQIFDHETSVSAWYSLVSRKRFRLLQKGVKGSQKFYVFSPQISGCLAQALVLVLQFPCALSVESCQPISLREKTKNKLLCHGLSLLGFVASVGVWRG